jgi:hypothetical protein
VLIKNAIIRIAGREAVMGGPGVCGGYLTKAPDTLDRLVRGLEALCWPGNENKRKTRKCAQSAAKAQLVGYCRGERTACKGQRMIGGTGGRHWNEALGVGATSYQG